MVAEKVKELEQENISLKVQLKELQNICGTNAKVPKNCEYCSNFVQHYGKCGSTFLSNVYGTLYGRTKK